MRSFLIGLFLLIATVCVGQTNGYPKKIVIGTDTVVALTIAQVREVNQTYVDLDQCKEERDTLKSIVNVHEQKDVVQEQQVKTLQESILLRDSLVQEKEVQIGEYKDLIKKRERKIKVLRVKNFVLGIGIIGTTTFAIIKSL